MCLCENQVYFGHETWKRRKKEECAPIGQAINLHLASYYRQRQEQKRTSGRPIASDLLGDKQRSYVSNSRFDIQQSIAYRSFPTGTSYCFSIEILPAASQLVGQSRPFSFCRRSIIGYKMMFQKCFANSWPSNSWPDSHSTILPTPRSCSSFTSVSSFLMPGALSGFRASSNDLISRRSFVTRVLH